jgi:predicted P-loop ATPase
MSKNNNNSDNGSKKSAPISVAVLEEKLKEIYVFRYDEILNTVEFRELDSDEFSEINEFDIYRRLHLNKVPVSMNSLKFLLGSDFIEKFNPIEEYFDQVSIHGVGGFKRDYIAEMAQYVATGDRDLFVHALKVWMVSAVRCVLETDFFNRKILVFFNTKQESGKTTLARFFVPTVLKKYSVENSIDGKDGLITLTNTFIHILDEMAPISGRNMQEFKSFISRDKVDVRPPYGTRRISRPRISSFIGTSDRFGFLPEDAGTSRFIVIEVIQINFEYANAIDIDKLWAQAISHYQKNEYLDFSLEWKRKIAELNQKYVFSTVLSEAILSVIEPSDEDNGEFMQTYEIVKLVTQETSVRISDRKIGTSLDALGFERVRHYLPERKMTVFGYFIYRVKSSSTN